MMKTKHVFDSPNIPKSRDHNKNTSIVHGIKSIKIVIPSLPVTWEGKAQWGYNNNCFNIVHYSSLLLYVLEFLIFV